MRSAGLTLPRLRGLRVSCRRISPRRSDDEQMRVELRSNFLPEPLASPAAITSTSSAFAWKSARCRTREKRAQALAAGLTSVGYRLFQRRWQHRSVDEDPKHALTTNRIAVLLPPDRPYRWSWHNAGGSPPPCVHPAFVEAVLGPARPAGPRLRTLPRPALPSTTRRKGSPDC